MNRRLPLLLLALCLLSSPSHSQSALHDRFAEICRKADGTIGIYVKVLETGDTASYQAAARYPMQSVYKFPIAMAVLHMIDQGELRLEEKIHILPSDILPNGHSPIREKHPKGNVDLSVAELLRLNVGESDGTACDVLLRIAGGPQMADAYIHSLGVKDMAIATTERVQQGPDEMVQYTNWAKPAAIVQLLELLQTGKALSPGSTALLLKLMAESGPGAKRLKGLLPKGTVVAHKTGTAATINGMTRATNDAGIITLPNGRHLAIAVFVSDSRATQTAREATIAAVARAAWDHYAR